MMIDSFSKLSVNTGKYKYKQNNNNVYTLCSIPLFQMTIVFINLITMEM